jgi:hypothetical protein
VSDGRWAGCGEGRGGSAARHQRGAELDRTPAGRSLTEWPSRGPSAQRSLFQDFVVPELCLPLPDGGTRAARLLQYGTSTYSRELVEPI